MPSRRLVLGGVSAGLAVLLFAVLVAGNYLSARHLSRRFDLTQNREFTVAPATRKILAALDDVVNVKVYFSRNLPERVAAIPSKVRDLLAEFEAHGKGKLQIENVDPQASPEAEQKARSLGILRVPLTVLERNKQQTVEVYLGIALSYGDQKEVIPAVLDNTNLEYEMMSRILRMTRPKKTIGFLAGFDSHEIFSDLTQIAQELREQYDVESVDLSGDKGVPEKVSTLIVAGPKKRLSDRARYEIDQFLMRGGRGLFLIDRLDVDMSSLMARPLDIGLDEQLASYGVKVLPSLLEDWGMNEVVQVPSGGETGGMPMVYVVQYPLWPKLVVDNISETHPVVNRLPSLVLPFTSPLEVVKDADDKFEIAELFKSTEFAKAEEQLFSAHPRSLQKPTKEQLKQYLLGVAITGSQRSFFAGKPVPAPEPKDAEAAPPPTPEPSPSAPRQDAVDSTQIVVVGGSTLITDAMLRQRAFQANAAFVLNAIDWLTVGEDLIGIRSRVASEPMLDPKKREIGEKLGPWINIVVVPFLVVMIGFLWRAARRRRRIVLA